MWPHTQRSHRDSALEGWRPGRRPGRGRAGLETKDSRARPPAAAAHLPGGPGPLPSPPLPEAAAAGGCCRAGWALGGGRWLSPPLRPHPLSHPLPATAELEPPPSRAPLRLRPARCSAFASHSPRSWEPGEFARHRLPGILPAAPHAPIPTTSTGGKENQTVTGWSLVLSRPP